LANVPIQINYNNLQHLLLNTFLEEWLKQFMGYSLNVKHIVSVQLLKGKNRIHLENQVHAILEHCLSPDKTKLSATTLNMLVVIDAEHLRKAKAHQDAVNEQYKDQETVCFSLTLFISNLIFSAV
jgi:hypothetical protein